MNSGSVHFEANWTEVASNCRKARTSCPTTICDSCSHICDVHFASIVRACYSTPLNYVTTHNNTQTVWLERSTIMPEEATAAAVFAEYRTTLSKASRLRRKETSNNRGPEN
jgi:hypothetical protein